MLLNKNEDGILEINYFSEDTNGYSTHPRKMWIFLLIIQSMVFFNNTIYLKELHGVETVDITNYVLQPSADRQEQTV